MTNGTWVVEECRLKVPDWANLVTVVLDPDPDNVSACQLASEFEQVIIMNKFKSHMDIFHVIFQTYPGIRINGKHLGDGDRWTELLASALRGSTPFILVARDVVNLLEGDEWVNLRRSLRLLQDASISVVAGASREGTLHIYICFKLFAMLH